MKTENMFLITGRLEGFDEDVTSIVEAESYGKAQAEFESSLREEEVDYDSALIIPYIVTLNSAIKDRIIAR